MHLVGLFPSSLLSQLAAAWARLEQEPSIRRDLAHLRGDREEIWFPYRPPFNLPALLQPPGLRRFLQAYLHDAKAARSGPVLDYVAGIVSRPQVAKVPTPTHP